MLNQINTFYDRKDFVLYSETHKVGDDVYLKEGTLLHGTYKNIDGLREIVKNGLISSWFTEGRYSKYPCSVGVWNLKKDYLLKDYINFYSGGTIEYASMVGEDLKRETEVIPFSEMDNIMDRIISKGYHRWEIEQTKEARFLPSLVQDDVQIGIIFNGNNETVRLLLEGDILSSEINDDDVKAFVNPYYYKKFIKERKEKDDFFTDRESAILFGVPSNLIEGILVGRIYEKDNKVLNEIKELLPNCYICNLDGKVIMK